MKAVRYFKYGQSDVLKYETDVPKPTPADDDVLVRVKAVSLNHSDWEFLEGKPAYVRMFGLFSPPKQILGTDVAGIVEAVGSKVAKFKVGDEVIGDIMYTARKGGALAEYVCAEEKMLTLKPKNLSFVEASALPQGGLVALQALRDTGKLKPGESVALNGAGGGSGTFAIQIARILGASEIVAVDHGSKAELMRSLGATRVIDYTQEDFTKLDTNHPGYDLIIDFVGFHSLGDFKRALKPNGRYVMVGGQVGQLLNTALSGLVTSFWSKKSTQVLMHESNHGMADLLDMVDKKQVVPQISQTFTLSEAPKALQQIGDGTALGKLVVIVDADDGAPN